MKGLTLVFLKKNIQINGAESVGLTKAKDKSIPDKTSVLKFEAFCNIYIEISKIEMI